MKQLTIITGPQASGKSTLAKLMAASKKAVIISEVGYGYLKEVMDSDPEIIILDEATIPKLETISQYIKEQTFTYRPPYSRTTVTKPFPKIIACSNQQINLEHISGISIEFINLKP